MDTNNVQLISV